jgi:TonB family protein
MSDTLDWIMRTLTFVALLLSTALPSFCQDNLCVLALESPDYPTLARQAQIEGVVEVEVVVAEDGHVISAKPVSGHKLLRQVAQENLKTWTFTRGSHREFDVTYQFQLQEPKVSYLPVTRVQFDLPNRVTLTTHAPLPIKDTNTSRQKK